MDSYLGIFVIIIVIHWLILDQEEGSMKKQKKQRQSSEANHDQQQQSLHQQVQQQASPSTPSPSPQYTFGSSPISMKCPFCHNRIKTQIIQKPQLISILLGLLLFTLLPNAVTIVLVVLILQTTATKKHRCSLCERELGNDGKFLVLFKDEVYSFRLGENGILISKKILVTLAIFGVMFAIVLLRAKIGNATDWTDLTWNQLLEQCPKSNATPCNHMNMDKTVKNWRGYVMRVQDRRDSMRKYYDNALQIYIKMAPSETPPKTPDLYLTATSSILWQLSETIDKLSHGDEVLFNATFYPLGRGIPPEAENRHMRIVGLEKTGARGEGIEVYMKDKEEQYFVERVQGKGLRQEKA